MKVSYNWLQTFFDSLLPDPQKIRAMLTRDAFEVEGLEQKGNDTVFDIAVLPNRGHDSLSHRGIAREIGTLFNLPLMRDPLGAPPSLRPDSNVFTVTLKDAARSPRYSAAVIKGVSVGPSPDWLKERLESIGQRSINNIVDATNYVMFDVGQPLHAFDMGQMAEKDGAYAILVRTAKQGEKITTLDLKEYEMIEDDLLIVDGMSNTPIGIAGVKGGKPTEITKTTTDIIIESANFHGSSIRKTAKRLKLRTDASVRFEHELSPELTSYALTEVIDLIVKVAGGTVEGYVDMYPTLQKERQIVVTLQEINGLLGTSLSEHEIIGILERLHFSFAEKNGTFTVTTPFERLDLNIKEDVVEEIGRVYGYENISPVMPKSESVPLEINKNFYYAEKIRDFLVNEGFSEVLTYSFVEKGKGEVETTNPVALDRPSLRKSLEVGITKSLEQNSRNLPLLGLSRVAIFEIGKVFDRNGEHTALGIGVTAPKKGDSIKILEKTVQKLHGLLDMSNDGPTRSIIGEGQFLEFNVEKLIEKLPQPNEYDISNSKLYDISYKSYSVYPFVLRDIAIFVPEGTNADEILSVIKKEAGELLANSMLFDEFKKEGKISYAFRFAYQAKDRTLTDEEVNKVMEKITAAITNRGWVVR
ncbi:MAG: hypothetical protein A2849_03495 [Candidatus Taylorbacteria bacterium RIFCSPHIGHO2_01_FULL_51_15]|uniref:Phenylalanine--tRNA ligase beta subunit n=1 Tax=Candidatus Taylorbacteria bacterium RIFCSPHIGHO2_01_FULL_51_15 TaxID=1802304 RepID=A0A1G2M8G6_9BACT|nr:MAG: hypothetical protein A2849_03495 [Candidatus Taylorbacteria bacterium RIFCSPHIGHO2_01_FULL_51_15]